MTGPEFGRGVRPGVRRLFRLPLRTPSRAHADADAELDSYIESRIEYFVARGMTPAQARLEALHRLGGSLSEVRAMLHHSAEGRERHMRFTDALDDVMQDIRFAARGLRRQPGFAIAAVACLAIGIGANTTMVGIVDSLLLRPPAGVRDPASLLWINAERTTPFGFSEMSGLAYPDYTDLTRASAIASAAAYHSQEDVFGSGKDARQINSLAITPGFMPLLGVSPALGRFFTADEDRPGAQPLVVLGYAFWQSQFARSTTVLGQAVQVGGTTYTIIGVGPRGFNGVERSRVDVYTPSLAGSSDLSVVTTRGKNWLTMLARSRPGIARERIREELDVIYHRERGTPPPGRPTSRIVVASPTATVAMHSAIEVQNATLSVWLTAVAAIVLALACANVASLLLTRALRRRREIAVRLTLGIGRGRLVRMLMTESLLIALIGGAVGLLVARWGGSVFRASLIPTTVADVSTFDGRILFVTLLATVLTGVACGLAPAVQATRPDLTVSLKAGEQGSTAARGRLLSGILVGQVALTLVLLVGAGLFVRSLRNLDVLDLGFDVQQVLRARVNRAAGSTAIAADQLVHGLLERTRTLPGVEAAALATAGPFGNGMMLPVSIPGHAREENPVPPGISAVTPGFFATLGISLKRGRLIVDTDRLGTDLVAVVNEAMARHYWAGADPIGKCIKIGGETAACTTVVGVVANARQGNITRLSIQYERPHETYYVPLEQQPVPQRIGIFGIILYVRNSGDGAALVPAVTRMVQEASPGALPDVTAFATALEPQIRPWRLGVMMFGVFGTIALVLAVVGLYGVLAFRVGQRQREIGVRISLGATRTDVQRLVLGEGLRLSALGVAIGLVAAITVGRALSTIVFGVSPRDPVILAATGAVLLAVAAIASAVPAWRATRIDPMRVLRDL